MPSPVTAEMGQIIVSPPHSSATRPYSVSCCFYALGVGGGLIHLVYRYDYGYAGGLGMVLSPYGLRHYSVVSGDHQNGYIRDRRAAARMEVNPRVPACRGRLSGGRLP